MREWCDMPKRLVVPTNQCIARTTKSCNRPCVANMRSQSLRAQSPNVLQCPHYQLNAVQLVAQSARSYALGTEDAVYKNPPIIYGNASQS